MSMHPNSTSYQSADAATSSRAVVRFFNVVYAWMAVGLALTALAAYVTAVTPALREAVYGNMAVVIGLSVGCLAISLIVQFTAGKLNSFAATMLFLLYASGLGVLCSYVFIVYQMKTIGAAFVLTGGIFGAMSVYGFVTKRDLSQMGSILCMALIGVILASVVNIFVASNMLSWIVTYAVLAIFIGITAYKTQELRDTAVVTANEPELANRYAVVGALVLYIAFINMFLAILRILGNRR